MTFKYVELFAGIGGFRQALDKIGGECVLASEIDKYASQAYRILYDGAEELRGDVTKIEADDVPDHDVLVGGFPCQAFSVAGKRLGFEDTRGTLFFEIARIARVKKPRVMLMENVKGLISHDKGRTLDVIVQTLGDIGYTVDFEVMNSKYFGVPQNRERIFIVAIRDDLVTPSPWEIGKRTDVVAKGKRRIAAIEGVKTFNFDWPEQNEVTVRLRDILERGVDEKFYLSEEKTAKLVRKLSEETRSKFENVDEIRLAQFCGDIGNRGISFSKDVSYTLRTVPHSDGGQHLQIPIEKCDSAIKQYEKFIDKNGYIPELFNPYNCTEIEEVAPTLTLMCDRVNASSTVLKLEPQMLGHIDLKGHDAIKRVYATEGVSPTLTPDRIEKRQNGRRFKEDDEESFTLTAQDRHGIAIGEKPRYRIRKLTPRECFRLQGFRDVDFDKLMANGISNSQLYKMAGNAVTVTVIDAIGKRLLPYLG